MALHFSFGDLPFAFITERITDPDRIKSIREGGPGGGFFTRQWWELHRRPRVGRRRED